MGIVFHCIFMFLLKSSMYFQFRKLNAYFGAIILRFAFGLADGKAIDVLIIVLEFK